MQGVGFRPFVYRLATSLNLTGSVKNMGSHVLIDVEGSRPLLDTFIKRLADERPPRALIAETIVTEQPCQDAQEFVITPSSPTVGHAERVYISPDTCLCDDCRSEMLDPNDRRYRYPFINCTNCGPRFTIVTGVPYDRAQTTMHPFTMCPDCAREYHDPTDRRYHAEPIACPVCGPRIMLSNCADNITVASGDEAMTRACALLQEGRILAIKGLGGYHLACNALDPAAVSELRQRKARDEKPFAVMAADLTVAARYGVTSDPEQAQLQTTASPIVLLARRTTADLPEEVAPGNPNLGVMLPYTPLHELLFQQSGLELLVMTSGNISGEPICFRDEEASSTLNGIADFILSHDREIATRVDDSVVRIVNGQEYPVRRSRGYVPQPVTVRNTKPEIAVLACGGHLKNTFCMNRGDAFYLSHHIGDLENYETLHAFEQGIALFEHILGITPNVLAYDLHPNYFSTQYAMNRDLQSVGIQHHRAHIAACIADNGLKGEVIGVAFDGTGYGDDGHIWGGEFFAGDLGHLERIGHLGYVAIPGGDSSVAEPWKTALGYLTHAYGDDVDTAQLLPGVTQEKASLIRAMLSREFNVYRTSSVGRLFDAVAALAGIRNVISHEGQAAIELEYASTRYTEDIASYPFTLAEQNGPFTINTADIVRGVVEDRIRAVPTGSIAARFHETVAQLILEGCLHTRANTDICRVVLSGGVFQNNRLLQRTLALLVSRGFTAFIHHRVPTNDGGLSLGQAVLALEIN